MNKVLTTFLLLTLANVAVFAKIPLANECEDVIAREMAGANATLEQGDNGVFLSDDVREWRNGDFECHKVKIMGDNDKVSHVGFITDPRGEDWESSNPFYYEVKVVKGVPRVLNHKGFTVKHQKIGDWELIVFRNAKGAVADVLIGSEERPRYEDLMRERQAMLNGVWVSARGDTATLGSPTGDRYGACPGDYQLEETENGWQILFAQNRMKVVEMPEVTKKEDPQTGLVTYYGDGKPISKEEYEFILSRPCGYGGHGALLGPIAWNIKPSADLKKIEVKLNEPYDKSQDFRYSPFDEERFTLSWVRSLYPGVKGRWAVASIRPLTRRMLRDVSSAGLREILSEFNSRHGKAATLSAVEKLNKSLVSTMLSEKK